MRKSVTEKMLADPAYQAVLAEWARELDEFEASYKQAIRDHFAKSEPPAPVGPAPRVESDGPITPV